MEGDNNRSGHWSIQRESLWVYVLAGFSSFWVYVLAGFSSCWVYVLAGFSFKFVFDFFFFMRVFNLDADVALKNIFYY